MKKLLFFLPFLLSSCASMYVPQMANVPLLKEKGDAQVELSVSSNSLYASADYALTDNYAIMVNSNVSHGTYSDYNDIFTPKDMERTRYTDLSIYGKYSHKYVEGAFGKYNMLQNEKYKLEAFVGGGYGRADEQAYHNKYGLVFAQADFGQSISWFDWGVSMRLATSIHDFKWQDDYGKSYHEDFSMVHIEPMIFLRIGGEHLKFSPKVGLSLPIQSPAFDNVESNIVESDYYRTTLFHFSLGMNYSF